MSKLGIRLIRASTALDRFGDRLRQLGPRMGPAAQRAVDVVTDARNDVVLAFASQQTLFAYCVKTYDANATFSAGDAKSFRKIWPWEEDALARFFPPAPARILIGGAGGGREAFALAERGYYVVAFDLSPRLAEAAATFIAREGIDRVRFYQGAYEDLPVLHPARADEFAADVTTLQPFDAAILGWVSYPHVLTRPRRVQALRDMAGVTVGPVLVSTFPRIRYGGKPIKPKLIRRVLPFGMARDPGNAFRPGPGFSHLFEKDEFLSEIREAGLVALHVHFPPKWNDRTDCPYAIVQRPAR